MVFLSRTEDRIQEIEYRRKLIDVIFSRQSQAIKLASSNSLQCQSAIDSEQFTKRQISTLTVAWLPKMSIYLRRPTVEIVVKLTLIRDLRWSFGPRSSVISIVGLWGRRVCTNIQYQVGCSKHQTHCISPRSSNLPISSKNVILINKLTTTMQTRTLLLTALIATTTALPLPQIFGSGPYIENGPDGFTATGPLG